MLKKIGNRTHRADCVSVSYRNKQTKVSKGNIMEAYLNKVDRQEGIFCEDRRH